MYFIGACKESGNSKTLQSAWCRPTFVTLDVHRVFDVDKLDRIGECKIHFNITPHTETSSEIYSS